MLQNAYFLAKIGADTAENEQHFVEILPTDARPWASRAVAEASFGPRASKNRIQEALFAMGEIVRPAGQPLAALTEPTSHGHFA